MIGVVTNMLVNTHRSILIFNMDNPVVSFNYIPKPTRGVDLDLDFGFLV